MTQPVSIAVVGAGNRGQTYADLAAADGRAQVVAVADPDYIRREELADRHAVSPDRRFDAWEALLSGPRIADVVVVATLDRLHYEPAVALLDRGYHLLLEKPIATTPEQCDDIVEAAERAGATFAVCHVMRYAPYSLTLQRLLNSGAIGELVSVEHLEPIGWWALRTLVRPRQLAA
jgi:predicted dehydrogenase